jgi:hypothetical protein
VVDQALSGAAGRRWGLVVVGGVRRRTSGTPRRWGWAAAQAASMGRPCGGASGRAAVRAAGEDGCKERRPARTSVRSGSRCDAV